MKPGHYYQLCTLFSFTVAKMASSFSFTSLPLCHFHYHRWVVHRSTVLRGFSIWNNLTKSLYSSPFLLFCFFFILLWSFYSSFRIRMRCHLNVRMETNDFSFPCDLTAEPVLFLSFYLVFQVLFSICIVVVISCGNNIGCCIKWRIHLMFLYTHLLTMTF